MLDAVVPALAPHPFIAQRPMRRIRSMAAYKTTLPALEAALGGGPARHAAAHSSSRGGDLLNGPRQWLVLGELELPSAHAAITEQTDGLSLIAVSGPHAVAILKKLLSIDIARFGGDEVAVTLAAHIGVRVWREADGYVLACFRSFAGALHHALAEAAESFMTGRG